MTKNLIIYTDKKGDLRWRLKFKGRIIAESGEGYKRMAALVRAWQRVQKLAPTITLEKAK